MDVMFSADLAVDDTVHTAELLIDRLGLPALRPSWGLVGRGLDYCLFLRASHPMSLSAPTLIEVIQRHPPRPWPAVGEQTPGRPMMTHATVLCTKDYETMIERVKRAGIRHYDMPDPGDGMRRCWVGIERLEPADGIEATEYDPSADQWLFLEVISWEGTALDGRPDLPIQPSEGGVRRVMARSCLVPDIDATLSALRFAFNWPEPDVQVRDSEFARYAWLQPALPASAALELIEPKGSEGRHGAFFQQWGPGPHAIRLEVADLHDKMRDLDARGTPWWRDHAPDGRDIIVVDPEALEGIIIEFGEPLKAVPSPRPHETSNL